MNSDRNGRTTDNVSQNDELKLILVKPIFLQIVEVPMRSCVSNLVVTTAFCPRDFVRRLWADGGVSRSVFNSLKTEIVYFESHTSNFGYFRIIVQSNHCDRVR